jgi:hypothetical protein
MERANFQQTCLRPQYVEINNQRQRPHCRDLSFSLTIHPGEHAHANTHIFEYYSETLLAGRVELSGDDFMHDLTFKSQSGLLP